MDQLERQLQLELTRKVAEDFKDPLGPLNALSVAAMASLGGCWGEGGWGGNTGSDPGGVALGG